jgi:hypothetical protein
MSRPIPPPVFLLKAYAIKQRGEKFCVAPSAVVDKQQWSKGYRSLQAACAAVARKLAEEWTACNARRRKFHRPAKER